MTIGDALQRAWDETKTLDSLVRLTHDGFANMSEAGRLIRLVKEAVHRLSPPGRVIDREADEKSVRAMEAMSASCKTILENGLPQLYQMATVSLWAILEASVDDLCVSFILANERWTKIETLRGIKGPLLEFVTAAPAARGDVPIAVEI